MSLLLGKKDILLINTRLAGIIGLNDAIVLQQLAYWLEETNSGIEHNGVRWIYNTHEQWVTQFPFWSVDTVKRTFASLNKRGLVIVKQLAAPMRNQTNHYTIDYAAVEVLNKSNPQSPIRAICTDGGGQSALMDKGNLPRSSNKTETTTETTTQGGHGATAPLSSAKLPPCPHGLLIDLFGQHLPTMPQPKKELWSGKNEEAMRSRWKWVMTAVKKNGDRYATTKEEAVAWFDRFFAYVGKSDFLTGRNDKWTSCDLGWLMKLDNFTKVLQGNYENKSAS